MSEGDKKPLREVEIHKDGDLSSGPKTTEGDKVKQIIKIDSEKGDVVVIEKYGGPNDGEPEIVRVKPD